MSRAGLVDESARERIRTALRTAVARCGTQEACAARLGVTRTQVTNLLAGRGGTSVATLDRLASMLGVSKAALLGWRSGDGRCPLCEASMSRAADAEAALAKAKRTLAAIRGMLK